MEKSSQFKAAFLIIFKKFCKRCILYLKKGIYELVVCLKFVERMVSYGVYSAN